MDTIHDLWHQIADTGRINCMRFHIDVPDTEPEVCIVFLAAAVFKNEAEEIGEASYKALSEKMLEKYGVPENDKTQ